MLDNPLYASHDEDFVRKLIVDNPWATIVSATDAGLIASHYPVMLDEGAELAILMHVGRPDNEVHGFGSTEVLVIIAGPNGYISPSWYDAPRAPVPTWDFVVAHLYGVPEELDADANAALLSRLTRHFEESVASPVNLTSDVLGRLGPGTFGLRMRVDRFLCKAKLSQDQDASTRSRIVAGLNRSGRYFNPVLASLIAAGTSAELSVFPRAGAAGPRTDTRAIGTEGSDRTR